MDPSSEPAPAQLSRVRAAVVVALAVLAGAAILRVERDPEPPPIRRPLTVTVTGLKAARSPFAGMRTAQITVGSRHLRVVIADEPEERATGLRGREDAGPYDGMLFVFPTTTDTAFTMAGVDTPLEIVFFDRAGERVDRLRMTPCLRPPCPRYTASAPFRYALESADGVPAGRLAVGRAPTVLVPTWQQPAADERHRP